MISGGVDRDLRGASALTTNTWSHLAATYNGSALTLYLNGVSIGTQAGTGSIATSTGALRLGGNAIWPEWFQGDIDEVRVYNRSLSAAEIQTDMNASVGNPDSTAPTQPGALTPSAGINSVNLTWCGIERQRRRHALQRAPGHDRGFHTESGKSDRDSGDPGYLDSGLSPGTYYYRVYGTGRSRKCVAALERSGGDSDRRHHGPERADVVRCDRLAQLRCTVLGRVDGQRRRHSVQHPPLDVSGLHPHRRQPDRTADEVRATRTPAAPPGPTTTSSSRRTRQAISHRLRPRRMRS